MAWTGLTVLASAGFGVLLVSFGVPGEGRQLSWRVDLAGDGSRGRMLLAAVHHTTVDADSCQAAAPRLGNTGFNKLMLFGAEFSDVTHDMVVLVVFGAAFMIAALWRFRLSAP